MTQGYQPGGARRSCGTIPRKSSRSPGPFLVVSHILFRRTVLTLQTPPVTHGPRASSVEVDCPIAACAFAWHVVNTADFSPRQVDISFVAIYFRELRLVGPSQVSRHAAVGTAAAMDRSWAWYPLQDRGYAQQTSQTPAGAPSEEDNLIHATKPKKSTKCVQSPFCGICGGIPGVCTKPLQSQKIGRQTSVHDLRRPKLPSEQRYMTMHSNVWKMWRCVQRRSHVSNCWYQNCILRQKRPYSRLFLYRSTDQPVFLVWLKRCRHVSGPFLANQGRSCR